MRREGDSALVRCGPRGVEVVISRKRSEFSEPDLESARALSYAEESIANTSSTVRIPRKRRRFSDSPALVAIRDELSKAADGLRADDLRADTLFFPLLPADLSTDTQLRAVIGSGISHLHQTQSRGRKMAWATFETEERCGAVYCNLRLQFPAMKLSLHRPRQTSKRKGTAGPCFQGESLTAFDRKVHDVKSRGGLGNTLMLRNLPVEVDCTELGFVVSKAARACDSAPKPLRIRSAVSKGKQARNFWLVYSSVASCRLAFALLHNETAIFRCGRTVNLHPAVHDDSTDADEGKRRRRSLALGTQQSAQGCTITAEVDRVKMLEELLRRSRTKLVFMSR